MLYPDIETIIPMVLSFRRDFLVEGVYVSCTCLLTGEFEFDQS
jgi:hypothetical protein